jgi:hypothetical protein
VKINPEIIKMLNMPFEIVYSEIERLEMKVPWKNISN